MELPSDFWQLPAIAVALLLVIGWLLYTQREERRSQTAERAEMVSYMRTLLQDAEAQRRQDLGSFATLLERNIVVQERTAAAISSFAQALAEETERHEERAQRRFEAAERQAEARCQGAVRQLQAER